MLAPGFAQGLDRATTLALLEELQQLRRTISRLRTIAHEIAQLLAPSP